MELIRFLLQQLEAEGETTRKMLGRVPVEKADWKPHQKSMALLPLATHVAELPSWIKMVLTTPELDFATTPYNPVSLKNNADLMTYFEKTLQEGKEYLGKATDDELSKNWKLRDGQTILSSSSKLDMIRITISQIIHHRAQLGVYLRLLNIAIPGSYGPSADEMEFNQKGVTV